MLAEVLLLLSGHSSSFFIPSFSAPSSSTATSTTSTLIVSPHLADYLHPGEVASLNSLASLAHQYRKVKTWAEDISKRGRHAVLIESLGGSRKGKEKSIDIRAQSKGKSRSGHGDEIPEVPDQYLSTLAGSVLEALAEYDVLVVETEARILASDPLLVQDKSQGYVPLSNLVATFDKWQAPLQSLSNLVDQLSSSPNQNGGDVDIRGAEEISDGEKVRWTPGQLSDLIYAKAQTGNPFLEKVYTDMLSSLIHLFLTHLVTFLLYGLAPSSSSPTFPSIVVDLGPDPSSPRYRVYKLNQDLMPSSINRSTQESILYIGRVAATLKREGRSLPPSLVDGVREQIMGLASLEEMGGLSEAIQSARAEVGEWLWRHILTGPQIAEAIESFASFFLTRKSDFSLSLLREISRLRLEKLILCNPHSSSSVIREQDLDLALLRASVGTSAELDRGLEGLRFRMERGPLRALLPVTGAGAGMGAKKATVKSRQDDAAGTGEGSSIRQLFSSTVLGTPIELVTSITWPLDLFLSPTSLSLYSDIHSYLLALRDTHLRVQEMWSSLSGSQRQRRKWTGDNEGGTTSLEQASRKRLVRSAWGTIRLMGWWLDQMIGHFMDDIVDVQHRKLLEQLELVDMGGGAEVAGLSGSVRGSASLRGSIGVGGTGLGIRTKSPGPTRGAATVTGTNTGTGYTPSVAGGGRPHSPLSETHTWGEGQTARSNRAPPTPTKLATNYLDFLTLRQIHSRHLSFLREGLLLTDLSIASIIRDILDVCRRFTGLVERWGGDVLPGLLEEGMGLEAENEGTGNLVEEREVALREINENLHDLLLELFSSLLDTQNPGGSNSKAGEGDRSTVPGGGRTNASTSKIHQISRMMRQTSFLKSRSASAPGFKSNTRPGAGSGGVGGGSGAGAGEKSRDKQAESEVVLSRHIEQLLLRLDFNGVLTRWKAQEDGDGFGAEGMGSILPEGGL